jgi:hypothetical protein
MQIKVTCTWSGNNAKAGLTIEDISQYFPAKRAMGGKTNE